MPQNDTTALLHFQGTLKGEKKELNALIDYSMKRRYSVIYCY